MGAEVCFLVETIISKEIGEFLISCNWIGPGGPAEFGKALGAEEDGAAVAFLPVVAAAHVALIQDAVQHGKHMACLVGGSFHGTQETQPEICRTFIWITVAIDGPYTHPLADRCLSKHEIPAPSRP